MSFLKLETTGNSLLGTNGEFHGRKDVAADRKQQWRDVSPFSSAADAGNYLETKNLICCGYRDVGVRETQYGKYAAAGTQSRGMSADLCERTCAWGCETCLTIFGATVHLSTGDIVLHGSHR